MAAQLFNLPFPTAFNSNGLPVAGAKVQFYATGTSTPQAVYEDSALTTPLTNPVVANAAARLPAIYLDGSLVYRVVILDEDGAPLGVDIDPYIPGVTSALVTTAPGSSVSSLTLLAGITPQADGQSAILTQEGRAGIFVFDESDLSAAAAIDTQKGVIVPPQGEDGSNGAWVRQFDNALSIKWFGAVGDNTADDTLAIQGAIDYAIYKGSLRVHVPAGTYKVTDTITIEQSFSLYIYGDGERTTKMKFHNAVSNKIMFDAASSSSNTHFEDIFFEDNTPGTSTLFEASDDLPDTDGFSHYKDSFERCRIANFNRGIVITSTQPTVGATHAHCSEFLFQHTRFRNNRTAFIIQNIQAVDLTLLATDIENDDSGESYTFIRDEAGVSINIYGGSFVGKGIFYDCTQAVGSSSLWQAGKLSVKDGRFELRATHNGTVLKPVASSFATNGLIVFTDCLFLCNGQTLNFINFGGKTNLVARNCRALNGTLNITQSPTTGITSTLSGGIYSSFGAVDVQDCLNFRYVKATSSPYGTYDERYTAPVIVTNSQADPNGNHTLDAQGFIVPKNPSSFGRATGISEMQTRRIAYGVDRPLSTFTDVKFILPYATTPIKLFLFKNAHTRTTNVEYKLYAVKDNADWVNPASFDVATDAIEIAHLSGTTNRAGYIEQDINLTSNYYDATRYFQSGFGEWTEGRMFLQIQSGTASGFVGVEYM